MADTAIDICSRALVLIGEKPITSFCGRRYALHRGEPALRTDCVRSMLGTRRWGFANTTQQLSRKTGTPVAGLGCRIRIAVRSPPDPPHHRRRPADPLRALRLDDPLQRRCQRNGGHDLRAPRREAEFPSYFTGALEIELAARFTMPITGQETLMGIWQREARKAWAEARSAGSQEQSSQRLPISRYKAARLGRG
jgi:hypothetical protein